MNITRYFWLIQKYLSSLLKTKKVSFNHQQNEAMPTFIKHTINKRREGKQEKCLKWFKTDFIVVTIIAIYIAGCFWLDYATDISGNWKTYK